MEHVHVNTDSKTTKPETGPPPSAKPEPEMAVRVLRMDLRNRVWTGFLYGVGIWCGSVVGIGLLFVISTIIATVLGVGLAGVASGFQP